MVRALLIALISLTAMPQMVWGCTSLISDGRATASGKPLLWKNRDTSALENFVAHIARPGEIPYTALYNAGDSALRDAWLGMNEAGFAIMNTASYNLAPDTARYKDREGEVMARALATCRTVQDFDSLLRVLPRPMGVQANFGVIDSRGGASFFETDDTSFTRYDAADAPDGVIFRTNYSVSGEIDGGYGYIREQNARDLTRDAIASRRLDPVFLVEEVSGSFYHSLLGRDCLVSGEHWVVDQDFIPRSSTSASVAIEAPGPDARMWVVLGYPPLGVTRLVTHGHIPEELLPDDTFHSRDATVAMARRAEAFSLRRGSGPRYVNLDAVRRYRTSICPSSVSGTSR